MILEISNSSTEITSKPQDWQLVAYVLLHVTLMTFDMVVLFGRIYLMLYKY